MKTVTIDSKEYNVKTTLATIKGVHKKYKRFLATNKRTPLQVLSFYYDLLWLSLVDKGDFKNFKDFESTVDTEDVYKSISTLLKIFFDKEVGQSEGGDQGNSPSPNG